MKVFKYRLRLHLVIFKLITSSSFIQITITGNIIISLFAGLFHLFESNTNPALNGFIDALWWAFATATTVGYGDIIPLTLQGKILGIMLMLTGTALFATYTALFAQTILEDEFLHFNFKKHFSGHQEKEIMNQLKKQQDEISKQIKKLEELQKIRNDKN